MTWFKVASYLAVFAFAFYLGGLRSGKAEAEAHAKAMGSLADQFQTELKRRVAAEQNLKKVQDAYDALKDTPDPLTVGLAQRVRVVEAASCSAVSAAGATAGGAPGPGAQPPSDERARAIVAANQAVYDACSADAKELTALQAWVRASNVAVP